MGEKGHTVDNCLTLKYEVQALIDGGIVEFDKTEPNVQENPLPEHEDVNVVLGEEGTHNTSEEIEPSGSIPVEESEYDELDDLDEYEKRREKARQGDRQFMKDALEKGIVTDTLGQDSGRYNFRVSYSPPPSFFMRSEEIVPSGWDDLDDSVDEELHKIILHKDKKNGRTGDGYTLGGNSSLQQPYGGYNSEDIDEDEMVAVIKSGVPYVIKLSEVDHHEPDPENPLEHMVIKLSDLEVNEPSVAEEQEKISPVVIKLPPVEKYDSKAVPWDYGTGEIDAVMRSGRCYPPREGEPEKRPANKENIEELQSVVRTSEYEIVEQLRKMPAQISLLDLFINSEKHKNALMKVLGEVRVPETINEEQFEDFVGAVLLKDQIVFSDEDFPKEGRVHNKALYISVKSRGKTVSRVLVDNGSAFNLCPLSTLKSLGISEDAIRTSKATIRAFDGGAKHVVGEIELDVMIGPTWFSIPFQVLDIPSAFSLLLGRPWIHTAGAVPSSLHQKVRFVVKDKIVTVHGELEHRVHVKDLVPCVEPQDEPNYDAFERVTVMHVPAGMKLNPPELSAPAAMAAKVLISHGFVPSQGLGKGGRGMKNPLQPNSNHHRCGLGYTGHSNTSRGRGRVGGRGRRGGRLPCSAGTGEWVCRGKMFDNPLTQAFSRVTRWLEDENVTTQTEPDLSNPFTDDRVNVIIEWFDDDANQPQ